MAQTVALDETMQEIIAEAIQEGLATNPEDVVTLALQNFWGKHLTHSTSDELRRIGEEAIADTRPGIPAEVLFAKLEALCRDLEEEHQSVHAA